MPLITRFCAWITLDLNPANSYITSVCTRNSSFTLWLQSKETKKFDYDIYFYSPYGIVRPSDKHQIVIYGIENPFTKVQIADKIEDYFTLYPSAKITRMTETKFDNGTIRYSIGSRFGGKLFDGRPELMMAVT